MPEAASFIAYISRQTNFPPSIVSLWINCFPLLVAHANPHTETNAAEANILLKNVIVFISFIV